MAEGHIADAGLARALARFPEQAPVLRRLASVDGEFREICFEYELAQASLARFEARPDAAERPEVDEYRTMIAELESEIGRCIGEALPGG
jgi:hypothetical protein